MTVQVAGRSVIDLGARATVLEAMDRVRGAAGAGAEEIVLAVAAGAPVLRSPAFLEVLRRAAPTRRMALVTADPRARSLAASVHMPAFASLAALERHELDATEPLGKATRAAIVAAAPARVSPLPRIAAAVAVLLALAVVFVVVAPTATVVVAPVSAPLGPGEYDLRAGPNDADINALTLGPVQISAKLTGTASGSRTVDSKATGIEHFQNTTTGDVRIPKGTIVSTPDNIRFQTLEEKTLPHSSISPLPPFVTFGTADIPIEAVDPGPRGNVDAKRITQTTGSVPYSVSNPQPTTGGDSKKIPVIQQSDYDGVAARADGELAKQADVQVGNWKKQVDKDHSVYGSFLTNRALTPASELVGKDAPEGGSFDVNATASASAYSVASVEPRLTAVDRLAATADPDNEVDKAGAAITVVGTPTVDAQGVHWRVRVSAEQFRRIDETAIRAAVVGRPLDAAEITRSVEAHGVQWRRVLTWPGWWPRMPFLASRIQIQKEAPAPASP